MKLGRNRRKDWAYKKIFAAHYGEIPKDEDGRSFDIHHVDGNYANNHPHNLVALSLEDHFDEHFEKGDWGACNILAGRLNVSAEEKSELARKSAFQQWENNTERRRLMSEWNRDRWKEDQEYVEKTTKRLRVIAKSGGVASREKCSLRIEYKGNIYVGWRELKKQTGVSKFLYRKFYLLGYDPEDRIGKDGPAPRSYMKRKISE